MLSITMPNGMEHTNLLVLAGGFGTRLRAAVSQVPKPLAPVAARPFLHYLLTQWINQGVARFTFLLHHHACLIEQFLDLEKTAGPFKDCEFNTLCESQPLGTGGAVAYAVQRLGLTGSFLVTNADTWLGTGLKKIANVATPAMAVVRVENAERYGSVKIEENGNIIAFQEKQDSGGPGWINAGLYHLHASHFQQWTGQPFSLERDLFPRLVASGDLRAVPLDTEFIDIGIPEDYFRFGRWIESQKTGVL